LGKREGDGGQGLCATGHLHPANEEIRQPKNNPPTNHEGGAAVKLTKKGSDIDGEKRGVGTCQKKAVKRKKEKKVGREGDRSRKTL